jgi:hypothetical protein
MPRQRLEQISRDDVIRAAANFTWSKKLPKWTVVVDGREVPARPLILAAVGVPPNDPTNSHMAVARLQTLGFEIRYEGHTQSPSSGPQLSTTFEGKELLHRELWRIVEREMTHADELTRGWFEPTLVAMVFAFHTVEAYLNFVGGQLDPQTWADERSYFRNEPYRGLAGKLHKVLDLVGLPWAPDVRPLKTVLELKTLRDLIAHGKPEKLAGQMAHSRDIEVPFPVSTLRSLATPKGRLSPILKDVEQLLDQIHKLAKPRIADIWFGDRALRGPSTYSVRHTTLATEQKS